MRVIGPLVVADVDPHAFGSRRARTFLKVLTAARGAPVSVDRIIVALWSDTPDPATPNDQVAVLASRVRAVLGRERIAKSDAGYALAVDWLDLIALDELERDARQRLDAGQFASARTAAVAALDLVRGPLFTDEPDAAWVDDERARFERRLAALHHTAAEAALGAGDDHLAVEQAQLALDADLYDEAALRLLMAGRFGWAPGLRARRVREVPDPARRRPRRGPQSRDGSSAHRSAARRAFAGPCAPGRVEREPTSSRHHPCAARP